jgi:sporulation integral membrane protein YlbJ
LANKLFDEVSDMAIDRRKVYPVLAQLAAALGIAALVSHPAEAMQAARDGLSLCVNIVVPSLFPFFVFASLAVESGLAQRVGIIFEPVMRPLFNIPGSCATAFVLGILSGYPVGARTAISMYGHGLCKKQEAERMLAFCNNSGPAFILGSVGLGIWGSGSVGILLYTAHILSSILVGICFRYYKRNLPPSLSKKRPAPSYVRVGPAIVESVRSSTMNIINICAFVVLFAVVIQMLFEVRLIPAAASLAGILTQPLGITQVHLEDLFSGFFELTTGLKMTGANQLSPSIMALSAAILGWAGLSVHCQVLSFLVGSGLSAKPYIMGKLLHSCLSAIVTYFWLSAGRSISPRQRAPQRPFQV